MRHTDIAIVGAGLAGSTAAAMLGRAGVNTLLIDPSPRHAFEFRCEKIDGSQIKVLRKTGLADPVLATATPMDQLWITRFGRFVQKKLSNDQVGIFYDALVNVIRDQIVQPAQFVQDKVIKIETSPDRQKLTLSDGEDVSARLVVLATGLNNALRQSLGMARHDLGQCYSVSIGFDLKPAEGSGFAFPALTYYPEAVSDRVAYLSLFPIGAVMRANLFVYRDLRDPWLRRLKDSPRTALYEVMPGLRKWLPDFELVGRVTVRPVDLYVTNGHRQPGVVLVGDAFATSCPAAGTGSGKVFTDVERLCNEHIPRWLASEGMGVDKIAAFYDDPVKMASDADSAERARWLKEKSADPSLYWRLHRQANFVSRLGLQAVRTAASALFAII